MLLVMRIIVTLKKVRHNKRSQSDSLKLSLFVLKGAQKAPILAVAAGVRFTHVWTI